MQRGKFIVIDGLDGSGKGTQIRLLSERLLSDSLIYTREPGGVDAAEKIRKLLMEVETTPLADLFLFSAARDIHMREKVVPALEKGINVLTDRYDSSTNSYQVWGECAHNPDQFREMKRVFTAIREAVPPWWLPNAYLFIKVPAKVAYERRQKDQAQEKTRFDLKPLEYYERVAAGYDAFNDYSFIGPCQNGRNVQYIDGTPDPEAVYVQVEAAVRHILAQPN